MKTINYHDKLLKSIYLRKDILAFEEIVDLIENKYLVTKFIEFIRFPEKQDDQQRWIKNIFKMVDYIDFTANDNSLLVYSSRYGFYDFVKYLIEEKGISRHTGYNCVFYEACSHNHLDIVKYITETPCRNCKEIVCAITKDAMKRALESPIRWGYLEIIEYLLANGADIHHLCDFPLRSAARIGNLSVVKFLVERPDCKVCEGRCCHGANIHAMKDAALTSAIKNNHTEIVEYLKKIIAEETNL